MAVMVVIVDPTGLRRVVVLEQVLPVGSCVLLIICLAGRIRGSSSGVGSGWPGPMAMALLARSDLDGGASLVGRVADLVLDHVPPCDCWVR